MRLLGLFAHPDDADAWCGGTLHTHVGEGDEVEVILFHCLNPVRRTEATRAAQLLGYRVQFLAASEYHQPSLESTVATIGDVAPSIILTHWHGDTHLEHRAVFEHALAMAHYIKRHVKPAPILLMTSSYFARGRDGSFEPDVICDISTAFDVKCAAIREHGSQRPDELIADVAAQNRLLGLRIGVAYAEGFREYPLFGRTAAARRESLRDLLTRRSSSAPSSSAGDPHFGNIDGRRS